MTDGSGVLTSRVVYGSKSHVPDYATIGGVDYQIVSNHLGSPVVVVNTSTGAVVQEIKYNEFGKILSDSNPGFTPFGFAGCLYDVDTKLCRFGARDYDARVGRWLSKDPILFAGGDTNLYGYVLQDPINLIDPSGLSGASTRFPILTPITGTNGQIIGAGTGALLGSLLPFPGSSFVGGMAGSAVGGFFDPGLGPKSFPYPVNTNLPIPPHTPKLPNPPSSSPSNACTPSYNGPTIGGI